MFIEYTNAIPATLSKRA